MLNFGGYTFDLTVVYDEETVVKRRPLWDGITAIRPTSNSNDWLIIDDFNEIQQHSSEREGHRSFDRVGASEFESAIYGFTELEAIRGDFTWENGTESQHTRFRLNRVLGNLQWITKWPQTCPRLILGMTNDHAELHIQLTQTEKGSMPFKFYNSWLKEEEFNDEFRRTWETPIEGSPLFRL